MKIKTELENLTKSDIYSLILFALYKCNESPEYSAISELAYILDKESLLKMCEYYGGLTIRIPTIDELERFLNALLVFQLVDIENNDLQETLLKVKNKNEHIKFLENDYNLIKQVLSKYNFNSGR